MGFSRQEHWSGKNTGVGCHFLLQRIFLTQGWYPGLPHCKQTLERLKKKKPDTCSLFPPFGDPWPSCLLPSHRESLEGGHLRCFVPYVCTVLWVTPWAHPHHSWGEARSSSTLSHPPPCTRRTLQVPQAVPSELPASAGLSAAPQAHDRGLSEDAQDCGHDGAEHPVPFRRAPQPDGGPASPELRAPVLLPA